MDVTNSTKQPPPIISNHFNIQNANFFPFIHFIIYLSYLAKEPALITLVAAANFDWWFDNLSLFLTFCNKI